MQNDMMEDNRRIGKEMWRNRIVWRAGVCGLIAVFISTSCIPIMGCHQFSTNDPQHPDVRGVAWINSIGISEDEGTLSGYVTDSEMSPVEAARVRVYFHDTYRENYSDATGYYHVTDIPICYCSKNATCAKEGYKTGWVWLSICENTTHDFVLTPFEGYSYPEFDGKLGENGWYVSSVLVTFAGSVNETYYRINETYWTKYTVPFTLSAQGIHLLEWTCDANKSEIYSVNLKIDSVGPSYTEITVKWVGMFKWQISIDVTDETSGVNRVWFNVTNYTDTEPPWQTIYRGCWWLRSLYSLYLWIFNRDLYDQYMFTPKLNAWDSAGNSFEQPSCTHEDHIDSI